MKTRFTSQFSQVVPLAAALVLTLPLICTAQGNSVAETLSAVGDGFPIKITYYPSNAKGDEQRNAPVVVIVPDKDEKGRLAWDKGSSPRNTDKQLPEALQQAGYAVITVDPRKQGESVIEGREEPIKPVDYRFMVLGDLEAVKQFIMDEHQDQKLNMAKMGFIASGSGAALAAAFAEFDWRKPPHDDHAIPAERTPRGQDVKALVLLSPKLRAGDAKTSTSISFLRNPNFEVALMIIVGEDDSQNFRNAKTIYNQFSSGGGNKERAVLLAAPRQKSEGIALLRQPLPVAYNPILQFLDNNLKSLEIEWRDRRSRLVR